jgi:hypothetical protein
MNYKDFLRQKHSAARKFWTEQAEAIDWYRKPETILSKDENGTHFGIKMGNWIFAIWLWQTHRTMVMYDLGSR